LSTKGPLAVADRAAEMQCRPGATSHAVYAIHELRIFATPGPQSAFPAVLAWPPSDQLGGTGKASLKEGSVLYGFGE
jgi:hypothetical protein